MAINARKYIENFVKIKDKRGDVIGFKFNSGQEKLYEAIRWCHENGRLPRIIVLKARQIGFSTLAAGIIFEQVATKHNRTGGVMAHRDDSTKSLMEKYKLIHRELPKEIKPSVAKDNDHEFWFNNKGKTGLNSGIKTYTAGGESIGRGDTFHYWHISEYAFWPNNKSAILLGILQTVPKEQDTLVIIESTANGFDDFRTRWYQAVNGKSDYIPVFVGWNEMEEYRVPFKETEPLSEEEIALKKEYDLDDEQIQWRRDTIRNECGGDIRMFHQEYPITPEEAFITTGNCYFETDKIVGRLRDIENVANPEIGDFVFDINYDESVNDKTIRWQKNPNGIVKLYTYPVVGRPYVIGGDTAGHGIDNSVGMVLDNISGNQVAVLCGNVDEDTYTYQMYCLGKWYNDALMCIEVNFSPYENKIMAERLNYPNMFLREVEDSITHQYQARYGFRTDQITRKLILAGLADVVRDRPEEIADVETLMEMLTFIINENKKPEAMQGEHDDRIMALAIAHYARTQQTTKVEMVKPVARRKLNKMRGFRRIC